jgi:two-component system, NtrC family, response regulator AtoC
MSVVTLKTPPLRDRRSDIPLLASNFLDQLNQRYRHQAGPLTPEALEHAPWRGNVRELRHVIERVVALQPLGSITVQDLFEQSHVSALSSAKAQEMPFDYAAARQQFEARWLKQLMEAADGNVSAAARMSGLARQNLYTRLRRYQE